MKSYQRVFVFVLLVLFLTCLLSPWLFALWNWTIGLNPGWEKYRYPFSRIFDRLFMVLGICLFFLYRRLLKIESFGQVGLTPFRRGYPDLLKGFFVAFASVIALIAAMSLSGTFTPYFRLPLSEALERSVKALLAGVTVGLLEEVFFRGMIFKGLMEDWKKPAAFLAANLFYSAIHFVKPAEEGSLSGLDAWTGFRHLLYSFQHVVDPASLPGMLGLFVMGIVLSYAFLRTGSLYLSIGLHAGWIFGTKTIRVYGSYSRDELGWLFGGGEPRLVSGAAGWVGIFLVGIVVHYMTRRGNKSRLFTPLPQ